jgi:hypothetical protein
MISLKILACTKDGRSAAAAKSNEISGTPAATAFLEYVLRFEARESLSFAVISRFGDLIPASQDKNGQYRRIFCENVD